MIPVQPVGRLLVDQVVVRLPGTTTRPTPSLESPSTARPRNRPPGHDHGLTCKIHLETPVRTSVRLFIDRSAPNIPDHEDHPGRRMIEDA